MTEAIVWLVLWFIFAWAGAWVSIAALGFLGVGLAAATDRVWVAPILLAIGWVLGVGWWVFSIVQVILQVIDVIQIASAGG